MDTSRQLVLQALEQKETASALELSRLLKTSPANIRHHLGILLNEGSIVPVGRLPSQGKGRPASLFSLTRQAQSHNLDRLASALILEFVNTIPVTEKDAALKRLAARLSGDSLPASGSLSQRLVRTVQRLNEMNYQARWEARARAPELILGHCPYKSILERHPELCLLDAFLLETLLQVALRQTSRLSRDRRGLEHCVFQIG